MESRIIKTLDFARDITIQNPRPKKHTSIILRKNEIVSVGTNLMAKQYGYLFDEVHSELDALLRYKGPKDNLILINYRFNRFGDMRMSKPCNKCTPWCVGVFDRIWYTTNDGLLQLDY